MSYRIVDAIKKNKVLPGKCKRVLEAWASFANADGTNIRPSKEKVAERAGISRWTCYRRTDDLLRAGILVADLNPDGSEKRRFYARGHYTTYYHIDLAVLQDATLLKEKLWSKTAKTRCSKTAKSNVAKGDATIPLDQDPIDDPSSVSTAVKKEGKEGSASLAPLGRSPEIKIESSHISHRSRSNGIVGRACLRYRSMADAESEVLVKPIPDPIARMCADLAFMDAIHSTEGEDIVPDPLFPNLWSDRLGRRITWEDLEAAEDYYIACFNEEFKRHKIFPDLVPLVEVMLDMEERYPFVERNRDWLHPIRDYLDWSRAHQPLKYQNWTLDSLAVSWWSSSSLNARFRWEQHNATAGAEGCKPCDNLKTTISEI